MSRKRAAMHPTGSSWFNCMPYFFDWQDSCDTDGHHGLIRNTIFTMFRAPLRCPLCYVARYFHNILRVRTRYYHRAGRPRRHNRSSVIVVINSPFNSRFIATPKGDPSLSYAILIGWRWKANSAIQSIYFAEWEAGSNSDRCKLQAPLLLAQMILSSAVLIKDLLTSFWV